MATAPALTSSANAVIPVLEPAKINAMNTTRNFLATVRMLLSIPFPFFSEDTVPTERRGQSCKGETRRGGAPAPDGTQRCAHTASGTQRAWYNVISCSPESSGSQKTLDTRRLWASNLTRRDNAPAHSNRLVWDSHPVPFYAPSAPTVRLLFNSKLFYGTPGVKLSTGITYTEFPKSAGRGPVR